MSRNVKSLEKINNEIKALEEKKDKQINESMEYLMKEMLKYDDSIKEYLVDANKIDLKEKARRLGRLFAMILRLEKEE